MFDFKLKKTTDDYHVICCCSSISPTWAWSPSLGRRKPSKTAIHAAKKALVRDFIIRAQTAAAAAHSLVESLREQLIEETEE